MTTTAPEPTAAEIAAAATAKAATEAATAKAAEAATAKAAEEADAKAKAKAEDSTDWKAEARKYEARAKANAEAAKELAALKGATATDQEKAVTAARAEATDAANARVLRLEVKAAAAALGFHDAADAFGSLDLAQFAADEHGDFDGTSIATALQAVLKAKPYLARPAAGQPAGHGNAGFGTGGVAAGSAQDRANRLAAATAKGDTKETTALKVASLFGNTRT